MESDRFAPESCSVKKGEKGAPSPPARWAMCGGNRLHQLNPLSTWLEAESLMPALAQALGVWWGANPTSWVLPLTSRFRLFKYLTLDKQYQNFSFLRLCARPSTKPFVCCASFHLQNSQFLDPFYRWRNRLETGCKLPKAEWGFQQNLFLVPWNVSGDPPNCCLWACKMQRNVPEMWLLGAGQIRAEALILDSCHFSMCCLIYFSQWFCEAGANISILQVRRQRLSCCPRASGWPLS